MSGPCVHLRRSVRGGFGPERVLGGFQDFMDIMASFDPVEEKLEGANDETSDGVDGDERRGCWGGGERCADGEDRAVRNGLTSGGMVKAGMPEGSAVRPELEPVPGMSTSDELYGLRSGD